MLTRQTDKQNRQCVRSKSSKPSHRERKGFLGYRTLSLLFLPQLICVSQGLARGRTCFYLPSPPHDGWARHNAVFGGLSASTGSGAPISSSHSRCRAPLTIPWSVCRKDYYSYLAPPLLAAEREALERQEEQACSVPSTSVTRGFDASLAFSGESPPLGLITGRLRQRPAASSMLGVS